jgi:hypothetical protein
MSDPLALVTVPHRVRSVGIHRKEDWRQGGAEEKKLAMMQAWGRQRRCQSIVRVASTCPVLLLVEVPISAAEQSLQRKVHVMDDEAIFTNMENLVRLFVPFFAFPPDPFPSHCLSIFSSTISFLIIPLCVIWSMWLLCSKQAIPEFLAVFLLHIFISFVCAWCDFLYLRYCSWR